MRVLVPAALALPLLVVISLSPGAHAADDVLAYRETMAILEGQRRTLAARYFDAADDRARRAVLADGRRQVFEALKDRVFPAWLGTPWSFNGTSRTPGKGSIACGSFVVFTLQDAGFRVPTRMLRQPSENIIKNLTPADAIGRFSNGAPMQRIAAFIRGRGDGLYMVGLDNHVGFLVNDGGRITFWHSTFLAPRPAVIAQDLFAFSPLTVSRYRVIGKLLGDGMMRKWLTGEGFPVVHDYFRRAGG